MGQNRSRLLQKTVWGHYRRHKRSMPWRSRPTPYFVVVSEIMLQQTQVDRVMKKFPSFIKRFPSWNSLAKASVQEVLKEWSGLGYNRRAVYLKRIAEIVVSDHRYGFLRKKRRKLIGTGLYESLRALSGIGPNTAGSVLAFAFNIPHPFIETNIRSVFIHHFFARSKKKVPDTKLIPLIEGSLADKKNRTNPREWYWALMDYGSYLKKQIINPSRKSAHHAHQPRFEGSNRQLRGILLKLALDSRPTHSHTARIMLPALKDYPKEQISAAHAALRAEGLITADF